MAAFSLSLTFVSVTLADAAVSIRYGKIDSVKTVEKEASHAGGAIAGGLLAGALAGPRHRALKIGASAAAGAAIQGAATSGEEQEYTVKIVGGGEERVTTEQDDIRVGDCVSIEQGKEANMRRVSGYHCEQTKQEDPPELHKVAADYCQQAKAELAKAETDDDIDDAVKKVRVLCDN